MPCATGTRPMVISSLAMIHHNGSSGSCSCVCPEDGSCDLGWKFAGGGHRHIESSCGTLDDVGLLGHPRRHTDGFTLIVLPLRNRSTGKLSGKSCRKA